MYRTQLAIFTCALVGLTASAAQAGVEYDDTNLHRSDDLVRFDRAYRAGLQDGTTTIIYSDARAARAAAGPDDVRSEAVNVDTRSREEDYSRPEPREERYSDAQSGYDDYSRYEDSLPEKMQSKDDAEKRRSFSEDRYRSERQSRDCDCDEGTKARAPKSEVVDRGEMAQPVSEPTMRERIDAVRKARELLRQSRTGSDVAVYGDLPEDDSETTKSLIEHAKPVTAETAPLSQYELDPDFVRNQEVSIDMPGATIEEIAQRLMPRGWRVRLSTSDPDVHSSKYEFVSSDAREVALRKLLIGTGLGYKMFFNLKDEHGNPSPLLVISEVHS